MRRGDVRDAQHCPAARTAKYCCGQPSVDCAYNARRSVWRCQREAEASAACIIITYRGVSPSASSTNLSCTPPVACSLAPVTFDYPQCPLPPDFIRSAPLILDRRLGTCATGVVITTEPFPNPLFNTFPPTPLLHPQLKFTHRAPRRSPVSYPALLSGAPAATSRPTSAHSYAAAHHDTRAAPLLSTYPQTLANAHIVPVSPARMATLSSVEECTSAFPVHHRPASSYHLQSSSEHRGNAAHASQTPEPAPLSVPEP